MHVSNVIPHILTENPTCKTDRTSPKKPLFPEEELRASLEERGWITAEGIATSSLVSQPLPDLGEAERQKLCCLLRYYDLPIEALQAQEIILETDACFLSSETAGKALPGAAITPPKNGEYTLTCYLDDSRLLPRKQILASKLFPTMHVHFSHGKPQKTYPFAVSITEYLKTGDPQKLLHVSPPNFFWQSLVDAACKFFCSPPWEKNKTLHYYWQCAQGYFSKEQTLSGTLFFCTKNLKDFCTSEKLSQIEIIALICSLPIAWYEKKALFHQLSLSHPLASCKTEQDLSLQIILHAASSIEGKISIAGQTIRICYTPWLVFSFPYAPECFLFDKPEFASNLQRALHPLQCQGGAQRLAELLRRLAVNTQNLPMLCLSQALSQKPLAQDEYEFVFTALTDDACLLQSLDNLWKDEIIGKIADNLAQNNDKSFKDRLALSIAASDCKEHKKYAFKISQGYPLQADTMIALVDLFAPAEALSILSRLSKKKVPNSSLDSQFQKVISQLQKPSQKEIDDLYNLFFLVKSYRQEDLFFLLRYCNESQSKQIFAKLKPQDKVEYYFRENQPLKAAKVFIDYLPTIQTNHEDYCKDFFEKLPPTRENLLYTIDQIRTVDCTNTAYDAFIACFLEKALACKAKTVPDEKIIAALKSLLGKKTLTERDLNILVKGRAFLPQFKDMLDRHKESLLANPELILTALDLYHLKDLSIEKIEAALRGLAPHDRRKLAIHQRLSRVFSQEYKTVYFDSLIAEGKEMDALKWMDVSGMICDLPRLRTCCMHLLEHLRYRECYRLITHHRLDELFLLLFEKMEQTANPDLARFLLEQPDPERAYNKFVPAAALAAENPRQGLELLNKYEAQDTVAWKKIGSHTAISHPLETFCGLLRVDGCENEKYKCLQTLEAKKSTSFLILLDRNFTKLSLQCLKFVLEKCFFLALKQKNWQPHINKIITHLHLLDKREKIWVNTIKFAVLKRGLDHPTPELPDLFAYHPIEASLVAEHLLKNFLMQSNRRKEAQSRMAGNILDLWLEHHQGSQIALLEMGNQIISTLSQIQTPCFEELCDLFLSHPTVLRSLNEEQCSDAWFCRICDHIESARSVESFRESASFLKKHVNKFVKQSDYDFCIRRLCINLVALIHKFTDGDTFKRDLNEIFLITIENDNRPFVSFYLVFDVLTSQLEMNDTLSAEGREFINSALFDSLEQLLVGPTIYVSEMIGLVNELIYTLPLQGQKQRLLALVNKMETLSNFCNKEDRPPISGAPDPDPTVFALCMEKFHLLLEGKCRTNTDELEVLLSLFDFTPPNSSNDLTETLIMLLLKNMNKLQNNKKFLLEASHKILTLCYHLKKGNCLRFTVLLQLLKLLDQTGLATPPLQQRANDLIILASTKNNRDSLAQLVGELGFFANDRRKLLLFLTETFVNDPDPLDTIYSLIGDLPEITSKETLKRLIELCYIYAEFFENPGEEEDACLIRFLRAVQVNDPNLLWQLINLLHFAKTSIFSNEIRSFNMIICGTTHQNREALTQILGNSNFFASNQNNFKALHLFLTENVLEGDDLINTFTNLFCQIPPIEHDETLQILIELCRKHIEIFNQPTERSHQILRILCCPIHTLSSTNKLTIDTVIGLFQFANELKEIKGQFAAALSKVVNYIPGDEIHKFLPLIQRLKNK